MNRRVVSGLLALMAVGCTVARSPSPGCGEEDLRIREAVMRHLIETYDALPPQFDDPVGREYCLGFDFEVDAKGTRAPAEFLERFAENGRVHPLAWCERNSGRLLSVGPLACSDAISAQAWSFSWVESRPGGSNCLHRLSKKDGQWTVENGCLGGMIYN